MLVWAFDRFARSTAHLTTTLEKSQALGVAFISYKQQVDTTSPAGKLLFTVLAGIAEFEREMCRERVAVGLAAAKRNGTRTGNPIGRPRISATKQGRAVALRKKRMSYREIAKALKIGHITARNYVVKAGEAG